MRCKLKNQLTECLAAKGVKKSQLAHHLRMSRAYVTRLICGDVYPRLEVAIRIARYFRKSVEEIFQLEEAKSIANPAAQPAMRALPQTNFSSALPSALGELTNTGGKTKK
jgi:putative transcriptional regulator